jgi:anti-sigma B factor antagonist
MFEIQTESVDGVRFIRLRGELDMANSRAVHQTLRDAVTNGLGVVVDLDKLTFIDSMGLRVLLKAKRLSDSTGCDLRFTRGHGHVAALLRLTALSQTFSFVETSEPTPVAGQPPPTAPHRTDSTGSRPERVRSEYPHETPESVRRLRSSLGS